MYRYNPFDPYSMSATYMEYTTTTTVPSYTLQHTLLSLSNQQSRIIAQREQLAAEERRLRRVRAATLRRIRAQRLREAIEQAEIEDIIETILEKDREGEREMREAVMEILKDARARKMESGENYGRELHREVKVREMLDPSRGKTSDQTIPVFHVHVTNTPQVQSQPIDPPKSFDTPVVDEVPSQSPHPFSPPLYFPEPPSAANKRGSRRDSVRRDSKPVSEIQETPSTTASATLAAFDLLRDRLQSELSSISPSIRSDVRPTAPEHKSLQVHIAKLEDILDGVDAVTLPTEPADDVAISRKARREIVTDIVAAIDGIERFIQPDTPTENVSTADDVNESDGEDSAFVDMEIQRVIRETLARKRDEESVSRRSVTVEEVPDAEY